MSQLPTDQPNRDTAVAAGQHQKDEAPFTSAFAPGATPDPAAGEAASAAGEPSGHGAGAPDVIHVPFADARWIELGDGVSLAPLRAESDGAGTGYLRFDAGGRSGAHRHPAGEDLYIVSGRLRVGDRVLEAGDFLHTPPGGVHDAEADEPTLALVSVPEPVEFL